MRIIRSIVVLIEMLIFATGAIIIGFIIIPSSSLFYRDLKKRKFCADIVHKSWKFFTFIIQKLGTINVEIQGNFNDIKGKVIVASHPSLIDIVLLIGLIPNSLCLAKKELLKNPIMYNIVKSLYILNDVDYDEFQIKTQTALEQEFNIIIFPTGTRTLPNEKIKIHKGSAQIAINTNTDIIPIKIEFDYPFLIKNHFPLDAGTKKINYKITKKDEIKINDFKTPEITDIKLRKILSEKIKKEITL